MKYLLAKFYKKRVRAQRALQQANSQVGTYLCLTLLLCTVGLGCSEPPPYELAEVRGSVTLDGKPLSSTAEVKFKVMFAPIAKAGSLKAGKPGFGLLAEDGSYILSTYGSEDGAVAGEHWVTLIRTRQATGNTPETYRAAKYDRYRLPIPQVVQAEQENVIDLQVTSAQLSKQFQ